LGAKVINDPGLEATGNKAKGNRHKKLKSGSEGLLPEDFREAPSVVVG
jgi:hypothetical protein